ncbi:MAG: hypothetical protein RJB13_1988 [Pseudomonadota bacterium]
MKFRWSFYAFFLMALTLPLTLHFTNEPKTDTLHLGSNSKTNTEESEKAKNSLIQAETVSSSNASVASGHSPIQDSDVPLKLRAETFKILPLSSVATQILLNVGWQKNKNKGLRSILRPQRPALGPLAMASFRGRLLIIDEADNRVAHLDSEGSIVETIVLPVSHPRQFHLNDDGNMIVWGPAEPHILYRSRGVLGEILDAGQPLAWQQIDLPNVVDPLTQTSTPVRPTRIFQILKDYYVEHRNGKLYRLIRGESPALHMLPGRPTSRAGLYVTATLENPENKSIDLLALNSESQTIWKRELQFSGKDPRIIALESSIHHDFVVLAWEMTEQDKRVTVCAKIDLSGRLISALELGRTHFDGFDIQDPILVDDKNSFLHMSVNLTGMTIERHAWK